MRPWLWGLTAGVVAAVVVPPAWCATPGDALYDGDPARAHALSIGVDGWIVDGVGRDAFATGSKRFDDEWVFGTHVMAALGFGQTALADLRAGRDADDDIARMDRALAALDAAEASAFDLDAYHGVAALDDDDGHAAWLGYGGLARGMRELVRARWADAVGAKYTPHPKSKAFEAAIRQRLRSGVLVETYPRERYPVDNSAMIGALGLFAAARGEAPPPEVATGARVLRGFVDPKTGLLVQSVAPDGRPYDGPRGSGTFLAAYFLSFADPALSASLYAAGRDALYESHGGFGAMREHPAGVARGGDIDSGPVVGGLGMSATGFALAGARIHHDRDVFRGLYATAHLFGGPTPWGDGGERYTSGGPLGDAILLAVTTAGEAP